MRLMIFSLCCLLALPGCGVVRGVATGLTSPFSGGVGGLRGAQTEVAGLRFRTRVSATTEDGRGFVATTASAGRSVAGAAEAGRTQANAYCLRQFGNSNIVWTIGPDQAVEQARPNGGSLALSGVCVAR